MTRENLRDFAYYIEEVKCTKAESTLRKVQSVLGTGDLFQTIATTGYRVEIYINIDRGFCPYAYQCIGPVLEVLYHECAALDARKKNYRGKMGMLRRWVYNIQKALRRGENPAHCIECCLDYTLSNDVPLYEDLISPSFLATNEEAYKAVCLRPKSLYI